MGLAVYKILLLIFVFIHTLIFGGSAPSSYFLLAKTPASILFGTSVAEGFAPWPTRLAPSEVPCRPRLFPLPPPVLDTGGGGQGKRACRRARLRCKVWDKACEIRAAANALFGGEMEHTGPKSLAQDSAVV